MPNALLSVSDKEGLKGLGKALSELGWRLLASGGTAKALRAAGLSVTDVADYTGSPEILGGRVKTLHSAIHAGLLARDSDADRDELEALGWEPIDLVAVNLYPFADTVAAPEATFAAAIENIDIGGVALIRAAAKNHERVTLLCDPADYEGVLGDLRDSGVGPDTRKKLALKGFAHTADYDTAIAAFLAPEQALRLQAYAVQSLRYGENPHQQASLYNWNPEQGPLGGTLLQGKPLSYNNLLDLDAAWRAAASFKKPTVVIVKHLSPCGIASADDVASAFPLALASDPVSAFGGVIAANRPFDREVAGLLGDLFVECIAALGFDEEACSALAERKNCRLLQMSGTGLEPRPELRSIVAGVLRQDLDIGDPVAEVGEWRVLTERVPSDDEWKSLRFAWTACQHVKSNAIVLVQGEATVGIGGGQPNRVDCVRIAGERSGKQSQGAVMASDAFFPFPDSVEEAATLGVRAIVQPGGSVRDQLSIDAANTAGMAMVATGVRHFRH